MVDFQVLRCYECGTFQVHQVTKSSKFSCKMCGEKQSVKKVYAVSSGKDCRMFVQQLNRTQGEKLDHSSHVLVTAGTSDDGCYKGDDDHCGGDVADGEPDLYCNGDRDAERSTSSSGRWARFVESTAPSEDTDNDEEAESVTLNKSEWMGCRRRGRGLAQVRKRQGPTEDQETLSHMSKRSRTPNAWIPCKHDTIRPQGKISLPFVQATVDPLFPQGKTDTTNSQVRGNSILVQGKTDDICNPETPSAVFPKGETDRVSYLRKTDFNQGKTNCLASQGQSYFCPQVKTDKIFPPQKVVSKFPQQKTSSVFLQSSKHVALFQTNDDFDEEL